MTNQTFYFPRFTQYVRARFNEKKRGYFWHFAISCMIYFLVLMMVVSTTSSYDETLYEYDMQRFFYYAGLLTTGGIFALRYFSDLAHGESALLTLMQPVSSFEKWLLAALTIIIAYPLVYTACFVVMTVPLLLGNHEPLFLPFFQNGSKPIFSLDSPLQQLYWWLSYIGMTGYALTTSIMFKRLPIIKSIALGFGLFLLFIFIAIWSRPNPGVVMFFFIRDVLGSEVRASTIAVNRAVIAGLMIWILPNILMWFASFRALVERDL